MAVNSKPVARPGPPAAARRWLALAAAILLFPIIFGFLVWFGPEFSLALAMHLAPYRHDRWYAVYLQNDQVFYAQIKSWGGDTVKLTNVHYLQTIQVGTTTTSNIVRRGKNELTMPKNFLLLNRAHVLYWEEIGERAVVMDIIRQENEQR